VQTDSPAHRLPAWPALAAYAAAFSLALGSSLLFVFAAAMLRSSGQRSRLGAEAASFAASAQGLMGGALVGAVVFASVALVAARLEGSPIVGRLRLGPTRANRIGVAAVVAGLIGINLACATTGEMLGVRGSGVIDAVAVAFQNPTPSRFAAAIATLGIAPGLAEEIFFRGLIQTRLVATWGRWPAIVATSAAFGLVHLDPLQGSIAFAAGLFLGWVVERVGGIRPTILAHVANNALFVTLAASGSSGGGSRAAQAAVVALGAALSATSVALLRTRGSVRGP
jgi:membrane protease YdiL (CAAX protease family)